MIPIDFSNFPDEVFRSSPVLFLDHWHLDSTQLFWHVAYIRLIHIVSWARQICAEQKDIQRIDRSGHYEKLTCICFHCLLLDLLIHPVVSVNKKQHEKKHRVPWVFINCFYCHVQWLGSNLPLLMENHHLFWENARTFEMTMFNTILVGGFNPSEKHNAVGMIIPNKWKK